MVLLLFRFLRNLVLLAFLAIVLEEAYFRLLYECDWSEYKGEYALVTGSSMGIGKALAEELASKGMNVILHGRRGEVLEGIKKEVKQKHPSVDVRYIVQDVVNNPKWDEVEKSIEGLKISVLVNNVGGGDLHGFDFLHKKELSKLEEIMDFNFYSSLRFTKMVLPVMLKQNRGRIMSASSLGHLFNYKFGVYPASKLAVHGLTMTINADYYDKGITAEAHVIGAVSTAGFGYYPTDRFGYCLTPEAIATKSVRQFGRREIYAPGFLHQLLYWFGRTLPSDIRARLTRAGTPGLKEEPDTKKKEEL